MKRKIINSLLCLGIALSSAGCSSKEELPPSQQLIKIPAGGVKEKIEKHESLYEKERKKFLSESMYSSKVPVKTPDKVMRVLTLPYVDEENNLQTENYHFVKVDEGRWVLGEYLTGQDRNDSKTLTPLK